MPLNRLQTLVSQESLETGDTCCDEDVVSVFPSLRSVPAETPSYVPQISGSPRQLGSHFFLWKGCWPEALRNGVSSSVAAVVVGMLMTKFCPNEE